MALIVKNTGGFSDDNLSIQLYDISGIYGVAGNGLTTGYGSPNPLTSDFVNCYFQVQFPDTSFLPNGTVYGDGVASIVVYPTLPNVLGNAATILNTSCGLNPTDEFPDGFYQGLISQTTGGSVKYTSAFFFVQDSQTKCCLDKLKASLCGCECDENSDKFQKYNKAKLLWDCYQTFKCADITRSAGYLKQLNSLVCCGCC